jgi:hypothetical protein
MPRLRFIPSLLVVLSLANWGCHSHDSTTPSAAALAPSAIPSSKMPDAPAMDDDDASALARKTSQYVNDVSPLLNQQATTPINPTSEPSVVQWNSTQPPVDQPVAPTAMAVQPVVAQPVTSPVAPVQAIAPAPVTPPATQPADLVVDDSANHPADLAAAKMNSDVPEILPESADHIPDASPSENGAETASSDQLEMKLHQQVLDYPRDLGNHLDYELLRFVRGEPTPDLSTSAGLSGEDREILSALLDGMNNFRNTVRADSNQLLSHKIQPLIDMADRLRSEAELSIPTIALCTRVDSFAVYKPMSAPRFPAGADNQVIVYCEVANFTSVQNNDKIWETRLTQEMTLYTETGMAVWPEKSDSQLFVDLARNRRHDFFIPRKVRLPADLTIGRYLLKVTITDPQSNRLAEATTPIEIVAE